jgi:hypothetical protein
MIGNLTLLALCLLLPGNTPASVTIQQHHHHTGNHAASSLPMAFPTIDPRYIYDQLATMVTNYPRREAGYSATNGHNGFAHYWTQEISNDLQGFAPQVTQDPFQVKGWAGRPATTSAFNVAVNVPGATHPEQVVVIGCHYDGEATSTQSANDDASGCAIELGVAKAMAASWRANHTYPARTLRFVLFDAEEQGVLGSFHYVNTTINGDLHHIVAMFNEEQSGIAYPLRYLGQIHNPQLPFYIEMTPLKDSTLYKHQTELPTEQKQNIARFQALSHQAIAPVFAQFRALGYQSLTYHDSNQHDVAQPIFTPAQASNIHPEEDQSGGSDQIPFTLAGIPCATFVGNVTYYAPNPPAWSYPYDQPQDTIQLMNTFADGNSQASNALALALALPGMFTTWMLNQPAILGQTSTRSTHSTTTKQSNNRGAQRTSYANPYAKYVNFDTGKPPHNPKVVFPTPDKGLSDAVTPKTIFQASVLQANHAQSQQANSDSLLAMQAPIIVALVVIIIGFAAGVFLFARRARKKGMP